MLYARLIGVSFVGMFVFALLMSSHFVKSHKFLFKTCVFLILICSLACMFFGADLLLGWSDPFQGADVSQYAASHGRKGGLIIFGIKYWPYVLIGLGAYFAYHSLRIIRIMAAGR